MDFKFNYLKKQIKKEGKASFYYTDIQTIPEFQIKKESNSHESKLLVLGGHSPIYDFVFSPDKLEEWCKSQNIDFVFDEADRLYNFRNKNEKLKISFDFDDTLSCDEMQELAIKYLQSGAEVFVVTSRTDYHEGLKFSNSDLFDVTDRIGIKRENIFFTKYDSKYKFTKEYDLHFDDDEVEINAINEFPSKCIGFLYKPRYNNQQANF